MRHAAMQPVCSNRQCTYAPNGGGTTKRPQPPNIGGPTPLFALLLPPSSPLFFSSLRRFPKAVPPCQRIPPIPLTRSLAPSVRVARYRTVSTAAAASRQQGVARKEKKQELANPVSTYMPIAHASTADLQIFVVEERWSERRKSPTHGPTYLPTSSLHASRTRPLHSTCPPTQHNPPTCTAHVPLEPLSHAARPSAGPPRPRQRK